MDENLKTLNLKVLENTAAALRGNNFEAAVCGTGAEAASAVLALAGKGKKVGLGGSVTLKTLGLPGSLEAAGGEIITHKPGMSAEEKRSVWLAAQASDLYLASPQAVTLDGKLIFIDGNGNRGAAVIYGPRKIVLLAGINKIVKDQEEGLWRSRNKAAIANNLRLKKDNPCVRTARCSDCSSPWRICNAVTLLWKKPSASDILVLLINEELGY